MSHEARRTLKLLAVPVAVGVGFAGWQILSDPRRTSQEPTELRTVAGVRDTAYAVPDGAIMVSPSGDDSASGSVGAPLRSVARAIEKAGASGTIVLRGGIYHESVTVPAGRRLTLQAYPRESVWFDGSSAVTGWTPHGGIWVSDRWTARFDASPTYTKGARPSGDSAFQFVDPRYPMAAHPDQLWVDGVAQRQVGSRAQVKDGTFYVDEEARRLYLGADPRGRAVRASTLDEAITVRGAGSTVRGIGVRRYATSLPQMGSVKIVASDVRVENVSVTDSATTGLSVLGARARVTNVTTARNGMLGLHANHADDLRLERVRTAGNNLERFKYAPVSGGIKITRTRRVAITASVATGNLGKGIWLDESVSDILLAANRVTGNAHHGISLELSAKAVLGGNVIRDNGGDGLKVNNTSEVRIWNNTFAGNGRTIYLVQDRRRPGAPGTPPGDPRRADPAMTWLLGEITLSNNILVAARSGGPCLLCVEDQSHRRGGARMGLVVNGNAYVVPGSTALRAMVIWSRGPGDPAAYRDLDAFRSATGQEEAGRRLESEEAAAGAPAARPLPATIAALLGSPEDAGRMGAWLRAS